MAETMVERMAEAIGNGVYRELGGPSDWCPADGAMEIVAREVLAAMREPTLYMIVSCGDLPGSIQHDWPRLIDAALSETEL